jgi:hypothetical protein
MIISHIYIYSSHFTAYPDQADHIMAKAKRLGCLTVCVYIYICDILLRHDISSLG